MLDLQVQPRLVVAHAKDPLATPGEEGGDIVVSHRRRTAWPLAGALLASLFAFVPPVYAYPNAVATTDAEYLAYGRVFSDPQGCLVTDTDGDGVNDVVPPGVSPWAKGNMCMTQFLSYEEAIQGTKYLAGRFPRYLQVIRLDEAYDNPNFMSAGIPRAFSTEDGTVKPIDRDRRPLYMFKVTDSQSPIPESKRLHFVYAGSIHGIERAGAEGSLRAMEDLVTWAANDAGQEDRRGAHREARPNRRRDARPVGDLLHPPEPRRLGSRPGRPG